MKVVIDAFGGDNAPDEVIKGAEQAVAELGVEVILTGSERHIKSRFSALGASYKNMTIVDTEEVIKIEDNPLDIRKSKINSSMGKAFQIVSSGEADAFVSGGSTAALVVGGTTLTGRIKGLKRPALAPIMPGINGFYMLLDCGANLECRPEMLLQFAVMGSVYMEKIMKIEKPRVGILNVGTEDKKGRELEQAAFKLLKNSSVNFIGSIEGRDPTLGTCDVVVTDGFTGNIYLKAIEGMGSFMKLSLNDIFKKNLGSKIGYLLAKSGVRALSVKMDYKEVGGSPLLGSAKPVIKAHGSSDARAFKNAVRQAKEFHEFGIIPEIEKNLLLFKGQSSEQIILGEDRNNND